MTPLAPGDQAFIIRSFCPTQEARLLGAVVTVVALKGQAVTFCCGCMQPTEIMDVAIIGLSGFRDGAYPTAWLRKIEPLSDLEKETEKSELLRYGVRPSPVTETT